MTITWVELTDGQSLLFKEAMKLYHHVFPLEVREPQQVFLNGFKYKKVNAPNAFHFLVGMKKDTLMGFATAHYLASVNVGFIVYLVTNPAIQSKGIGSEMLKVLEKRLQEDARAAGNEYLHAIILETEKKEEVHTESERNDCDRRTRFFEKNEYQRILNLHYLQPPLHTMVQAVPLDLWIKRMQPQDLGEVVGLHTMIRSIYREKYQKVNQIKEHVLEECLTQIKCNFL